MISFRPLSRGLFFNAIAISKLAELSKESFRPLSRGLFFNRKRKYQVCDYKSFSSPLSGTFFQYTTCYNMHSERVFVPSLGDFFSMLTLSK